MDVDEMYSLMKFISNKNQQGYLPPEKFHLVANQGQRSYTSWLLGSFQSYQPGRPMATVELGDNSVVRQRLSPVIYGYTLNVDSGGKSPYPGDFIQVDAMWSFYNINRIRFTEQSRLFSFYNSVIDPIVTNPIYLIEDTGFQFYPETISQAKLSYVRDAPDIIWGYTLDVNGRPVYNAATSQQPVWDTAAIFDIIVRALELVGISLQQQQVIAYSQEIKKAGQ
jgi:hypothetical protein